MMAEAQGDDDDDIFVYMGGNQEVPDEVRRARIHISVKIVREGAFNNRQQLISVEFHDGVEIIEEFAFNDCTSFKGPIKLLGVRIIEAYAFCECPLTDVEFGDKLETIEGEAFVGTRLKNIRISSVRTIGNHAFGCCFELFDVEFGDELEALYRETFANCDKLKRVALPLKSNMIGDDVFLYCPKLQTVDLVGGIRQTIASLHFESWRNEMNNEINSINQTLPTTKTWGKTEAIQQWMESSFHRLDHFKAEHHNILKEATTLLELALWKANLDHTGGDKHASEGVRTTRGSRKRARKEVCVTSGAGIVIKNVIPFLQLPK